jgi:hypothetical protein
MKEIADRSRERCFCKGLQAWRQARSGVCRSVLISGVLGATSWVFDGSGIAQRYSESGPWFPRARFALA